MRTGSLIAFYSAGQLNPDGRAKVLTDDIVQPPLPIY